MASRRRRALFGPVEVQSHLSKTPTIGNPQVVPGCKWIRGLLDGQVVFDSREYQYVWEIPNWPCWYFPRSHINGNLVEAAGSTSTDLPDGAVRYDLVCPNRTIASAVRGFRGHPDPVIGDLVTIGFDALDHWFEDEIEVFVHPCSPYTRVDALASSRHVVITLDGVQLADSRKPTVSSKLTIKPVHSSNADRPDPTCRVSPFGFDFAIIRD